MAHWHGSLIVVAKFGKKRKQNHMKTETEVELFLNSEQEKILAGDIDPDKAKAILCRMCQLAQKYTRGKHTHAQGLEKGLIQSLLEFKEEVGE